MPGFDAIESKMRAEGLSDASCAAFRHYWQQLADGETGLLPESDIEPVGEIPTLDSIREGPRDRSELDGLVVVKLNGGLGTSMGMTRAKSLVEVKDGLSFLEIIVRQTLALRKSTGGRIPLVLMNSFRTRDDSLRVLAGHPEMESDLPPDFLQNKVPKIRADDLGPVAWPEDRELEWCPPGHGDLYVALASSGLLDRLLEAGFRWAFVSNADNLGAVPDPSLLAWMASNELPFVMEVAHRTEADRKGGHLARLGDGRLVLREIAQCPESDSEAFQDVVRHRWFNTNNIWMDLRAVKVVLEEHGGFVALPMIRNVKSVDPADSTSQRVYQLETAMGAALSVFGGAQAVAVDRDRFVPVKTTNDLLKLWSDIYALSHDDWTLSASPDRAVDDLVVDLDPDHYRLLDDFSSRFPSGAPSLVGCTHFGVEGDVRFGSGVVARGDVMVHADSATDLPDGALLEGAVRL